LIIFSLAFDLAILNNGFIENIVDSNVSATCTFSDLLLSVIAFDVDDDDEESDNDDLLTFNNDDDNDLLTFNNDDDII
jgi:hypothetical protein